MIYWSLGLNRKPAGHLKYLVIHIRDIHDELAVQKEVITHDSTKDARRDIVSGMPKTGVVANRWAAHIPGHLVAAGDEWSL